MGSIKNVCHVCDANPFYIFSNKRWPRVIIEGDDVLNYTSRSGALNFFFTPLIPSWVVRTTL